MGAKHERHIRDARNILDRLRDAGMIYEADVVQRLCRSSEASMAENRRVNAEVRKIMDQAKK